MLFISCCQAKTMIVDPGGSGDADTLMDAVLLADSGDSILIKPGNYLATTVDKSLTISGSPGVVVDGALVVTAPGCRISDIEIAKGSEESNAAVRLDSSDNQLLCCTVSAIATAVVVTGENNTIADSRIDSPQGIEIFGPENKVLGSEILGGTAIRINRTWGGMVSGCRISATEGVLIEDSAGNSVINNTYAGNGLGVVLTRSARDEISRNNLSGSLVSGIDVVDSSNCNLTENKISGGQIGISLRGSNGCNVSENACLKNERAGIFLDSASGNSIVGNHLSKNGNGILLQGCSENRLVSNQPSQNTYGITLRGSMGNTMQKNILRGNSYNLRIEPGQGWSDSSDYDCFVQDIDESNLVDGKPVYYLIGKADLSVPNECGFLGLVSCRDIRAANLTIANSSVGVLLVNSSNCNIQNSSISFAESGFLLEDCIAAVISQCRVTECNTGLSADGSSSCLFADNAVNNCLAEGFRADGSQGMGIIGSRVLSCQTGIALHSCRLCRIQGCRSEKNIEEGVVLSKSNNCTLIKNIASSNGYGISLMGSNSCLLQDNNASANDNDGISLQQLSDADLLNNTALFNGQGIFIQSSNRLAIRGNAIGENSRFGLRMSSSEGCNVTDNDIYENQFAGANLVDCTNNLLYHNVFRDNGIQNAADNGQNRWDAGADGGGNYWSDYRVSSSLADSSYQVAGGLLDRYPFQVPWEWL
ncbi:MAG: NosD domain-containing protein [Methanothrix sp.]|nr:NosD domain-containing protein [Methanothrix sp.]